MTIPTTHIPENGDRLSRDDFELLCGAWNIENAELINGVVHMNAAAVRFREHGKPHSQIMLWLGTYAAEFPDIEVGDNTSVRFDSENEPQPDAVMFRSDGSCSISQDGYLEGIPELVVEIAASSVSYDAHENHRLYEEHQVAEYLLWRTEEREVDWFQLSDGSYRNITPDAQGIMTSTVFPQLRLNRDAMLASDMQTVLKTVNPNPKVVS